MSFAPDRAASSTAAGFSPPYGAVQHQGAQKIAVRLDRPEQLRPLPGAKVVGLDAVPAHTGGGNPAAHLQVIQLSGQHVRRAVDVEIIGPLYQLFHSTLQISSQYCRTIFPAITITPGRAARQSPRKIFWRGSESQGPSQRSGQTTQLSLLNLLCYWTLLSFFFLLLFLILVQNEILSF